MAPCIFGWYIHWMKRSHFSSCGPVTKRFAMGSGVRMLVYRQIMPFDCEGLTLMTPRMQSFSSSLESCLAVYPTSSPTLAPTDHQRIVLAHRHIKHTCRLPDCTSSERRDRIPQGQGWWAEWNENFRVFEDERMRDTQYNQLRTRSIRFWACFPSRLVLDQ